ncbi:leucine zipper domain-containing protein, partial [Escherichia coli]|uniref:leucine zipper domain-containing protein n=1 Tax=Escherichia coli TaxID=562 RepID=UPI00193317FE
SKRRVLCRRVVQEQWTLTKAAEAAEVSVRCARKWVARYRAEGELGLLDRPSAPVTVANRTCERRVDSGIASASAISGPVNRNRRSAAIAPTR